jgi:hypothetical protein
VHCLPAKGLAEKLSFVEVAETDPNLALVGLRIELEERLRASTARHSIPDRQPLMRIFRQLQEKKALSNPVLSGLQELVSFGKLAATGPQVLAFPDENLGAKD